jgi:CheY-like chemotaxis protein
MRKHVLLIDDDGDEVDIFNEALSALTIPFKCTAVNSPEEAFQLLKDFFPEYIFIDYNMPKIDGLKCLESIKKMPGVENIPCILYSNYIDDEITKKALALGAKACIKKPNMISTLSKRLKELLT